MVQAKALRYVTAPTDRQMGIKYSLHIVEQNFFPPHQLSGRTQESRLMVGPMNFSKRLTAIYAVLATVPSH